MDGENSYESDISESWSLIDINLNEESVTAAEALSVLQNEKISSLDADNEKLIKSKHLPFNDLNTSNEETETACSRLSGSDLPLNNEEPVTLKESDNEESSCIKVSDDGSKNDSCDAESIEILDLDGNYRDADIEKLDVLFIRKNDLDDTYHSDDEKSLCDENFNNENSGSLRRKRRKLSKFSDCCKNVNSEFESWSENTLERENIDNVGNSRALVGHPVYKHYRNNFANTILSLSMGLIFAGVACIAIGHFLGVHDAKESAGELMETLKKLQMENVALQSRLSHLNKAFSENELKLKFDQPARESEENNFCYSSEGLALPETGKPNLSSLPEIPPSGHLIEWLTKLQNLLKNRHKCSASDKELDFQKIEVYIQDQLTFLNSKTKEGTKILEDSETKISKILKKVVEKLSSKQDNIELLYRKLIKLKNKLNKKLSEIFPDENFGDRGDGEEEKVKESAKELGPLPIQLTQNLKEIPVNSSETVMYKFPQPEDFYMKKIQVTESKENRKNATFSENTNGSDKQNDKSKTNDSKRKKRDEEEKKNRKKKEDTEKKEDKSQVFKTKTEKKAKKDDSESRRRRDFFIKKSKRRWNEMKYPKREILKSDKNLKKFLKEFSEKVNLSKRKTKRSKVGAKKEGRKRRLCSSKPSAQDHSPACFNLTENWVFKWANGRQESRRHQTLSDWQFRRAKARKEQRSEGFGLNWQFKRALARESVRSDEGWHY